MTTQRFDVASTFGVKARPGLEVLGYADASHPQIPVKQPYVFRSELLRDVLAYLHDAGGDGMLLTGPTETLTSCAPLYLIENSSFPVCHWLFAGYHATHLLRSVTISRFLGSPTVLRRKPASPARPFV